MVYDIGARTSLSVGWGHFYQSQKIHDLQVEDGLTQFQSPERSEHRTLGIRHGFRNGLALQATAYQKRVTDPRVRFENLFDPYGFFPEAQNDRVRLEPTRAESRGLELGVEGPSGTNLGWWAHYALGTTEDEIDGAWAPRSWDQRHTVGFGVSYRLRRWWELGLAGTFHSGRPTTSVRVEDVVFPDGSPGFAPALGERNGQRLPAFHRVDLRASRLLQLKRMQFRFFLDIANVYNQANPTGIYQLDVTPDGELTVRETSGLPRITRFGVNWRF